MSINGTIPASSELSNHISPIATPQTSARQNLTPPLPQTSVTLNTVAAPHKRNVASGLANTVYSLPQNAIRPAGNGGAPLSVSALTTQLHTTDAQINRLLQRQPDFQRVTESALRSALQDAIPALRSATDLDQIYVTEYVNEVLELPGDDMVSQRRPTSSMTLRNVLQNTISSGHAPRYNPQQTGFFHAAGNAVNNPAEVVQGMHTAAHVVSFIAALQQVADNSRATYQKACQDFWNQPDSTSGNSQTPKAQLISAYRQQRLTEANLRVGDQTLSATSEGLFKRACASDNPAALHNSLGVFSLALQSDNATTPIALAGVLLITRSGNEPPDTTAGPVLLSLPGQGLMEFASSVPFKEMLRQWFDDDDQRAILLRRVARQERNHVEDSGNSLQHADPYRYHAVSTPVIANTIESLLNQQNLDIMNAFSSAGTQQHAGETILNAAADLQSGFDLAGIQKTRQELLVEQFLKNATTNDRTTWLQELKQYQVALKKAQSGALPLMHQYLDPEFLHQYTKTHIQQQLENDLQLALDPDNVNIITSELVAHVAPEPLPTTMSLQTTSRTLTELAMSGTTALDSAHRDKVTATDKDGYNVPQLTHDYLTRMVRSLNIGQHYKEMLQAHLLNSPEGLERERQYAQFLAAQLQLDAREAKIRGDLTEDGRRWVHETLAARPLTVNGQVVQARQLSISGNPLGNILLFGTLAPVLARHAPRFQPISQAYNTQALAPDTPFSNTGIAKVILYTPDAPDGKRLREFDSRSDMRKNFLNNPAMRNYLRQQVALSGQDKVSNILTQTTPDIDISDSVMPGNFLRTAYRLQAKQIIDNADARTVSNDEVARQVRQDRINMALDIAGILLPAKFTIPISLGRALQSFVSAHEVNARGNKEETLIEFIGSLEHVGDAITDGLMSRKKLTAGRSHFRSPSATSTIQPIPVNALDPISGRASESPRKLEQQPSGNLSATISQTQSSLNVPPGMSSVEIDGATFYYWQTANNTVPYRDLFEPDPAHPDQLKAAGYGAPDAQNVWRKISLRGGGGMQSLAARIGDRAPNQEIQRLVHRIEGPNDNIDFFSAEIANSVRRLVYNFQDNSFSDPASRSGTRYFPKYNVMQPLRPEVKRAVTDADRETTLRALGINLKLPLKFPPTAPKNTTPIPRLIHSVWVGGEIPATRLDSILKSLENNAVMAKSGSAPYDMKLYLSNRNAAAYEKNLQHIQSKAPTVQVVVLENTPFYQHFRQSKYFSQYMAAIDGNGGIATNYATAADVLRYRLLHHEGGLYMDCDDTLMAAPGSINLSTTRNGLALDEPVSNILLGMDMQYNTSIFGSQKNNPTLDAISEASYQRFLENRELYANPRPRRFTDAQRRTKTIRQNTDNEKQLYAYMRNISYVTGPNIFNKVIEDELPDMRQLREAIKLKEHSWNFRLSSSMRTNIAAWAETRLPLGQINVMGNAHTWDETRR